MPDTWACHRSPPDQTKWGTARFDPRDRLRRHPLSSRAPLFWPGIGHFTDGHQFFAGERPRECGTYLRPVADHPNVVVVSHSFLLGTLDDEVLQESINDVCHLIGFPSPRFFTSKGIHHGTGLVDQE